MYKSKEDFETEISYESDKKDSYVVKIGGTPYIVDVCVNSWMFGGTCRCVSHNTFRYTHIPEETYNKYK